MTSPLKSSTFCGPTSRLGSAASVDVVDWVEGVKSFARHALLNPLIRLCLVFDRRFYDPRFAGLIEAEHDRACGRDRRAISVDHGVDGHDERAILPPFFRFLPVQTCDMREFFAVLEPFRDVCLGQVR